MSDIHNLEDEEISSHEIIGPGGQVIAVPGATHVGIGVRPYGVFHHVGTFAGAGPLTLSLSIEDKKNALEGCKKAHRDKIEQATEKLTDCIAELNPNHRKKGQAGYDRCIKEYNKACDAADAAFLLNKERYG